MFKLVELLKYIPVVLVILGFVNLHSYYSSFGIEIYNYIDTLELMLSFSPILFELSKASMGLLIGFAINQALIPYDNLPSVDKKEKIKIIDREFISNVHWTEYLYELFSLITLRSRLFLMVVWALFLYYTIYTYEPKYLSNVSEAVLISTYVLFFIVFLNMTIKLSNHFGYTSDNKNVLLLILFIITMSIYLSSYNKIKAKNIMLGKPKYDVTLYSNQGETKSDSITHYLGSTRNYHFLYDRPRKHVIILNNNTINRLELVRKRTGI